MGASSSSQEMVVETSSLLPERRKLLSTLAVPVGAEFFGTMLFQLLGGSSTAPSNNGLILMVLIFCTSKASGGVLNPAVATSLVCVGEIDLLRWGNYCLAEIFGAIVGAAITPGDRNNDWGIYTDHPGCLPPQNDLGVTFMWEAVGTFILCSTVLATAVAKPGFGNLAPIAIGLAVIVNVIVSGGITGGAYNPARFLGPAVAFGCRLDKFVIYICAQLLGAFLAAFVHRFVLEKEEAAADSPAAESKV